MRRVPSTWGAYRAALDELAAMKGTRLVSKPNQRDSSVGASRKKML
jgi:hypothetical protein